MSLAHAYAATIRASGEKASSKTFVDKLVSFMRARGHLSLLPEIVRILEREPAAVSVPVVTVADKDSFTKFRSEIKDALAALGTESATVREVVDPRAVGGYSVRAGSRIVDTTFRSALVNLYQNTIRQ